jgi:hypothetical protein
MSQFREQQRQEAAKSQQWRDAFHRQQEQDRETREKEGLRRFEETLARVSEDLSSDKACPPSIGGSRLNPGLG